MIIFDAASHTYRTSTGVIVPSVTQALKYADGAPDWSGVDPTVLAHAADRGRTVHEICRLFSEGTLNSETVDERLMPYLHGWQAFLRETTFEPVEWEVVHHHPDDGEQDEYVGRCDCYGYRGNDDGILIEIKTGAAQPTDAAQLAAYWEAWRVARSDDPIARGWLVRLPGNGSYKIEGLSAADARLQYRYTFLPALRRWREENER
ncbi:MAG: hypothetical protein GWN29_05500 [Gammaproteobacteria bacterium]|nr:hypothetical protein [Gammaproteobacteria bacterium]